MAVKSHIFKIPTYVIGFILDVKLHLQSIFAV